MAAQLTPAVGKTIINWEQPLRLSKLLNTEIFNAPIAGTAYPIVKHILQLFGEQIRFVFRNLPLTDIHEYAMIAAMAAEAAGLQGKYWEMNDLIYENQPDLDEELLYALANELGLDPKKFEHDLQSTALQQKINEDIRSAEESEVPGPLHFL